MSTLARLAQHDGLFQATRTHLVDFSDETSVTLAIDWWVEMTEAGGEGMAPEHIVRLRKRGLWRSSAH